MQNSETFEIQTFLFILQLFSVIDITIFRLVFKLTTEINSNSTYPLSEPSERYKNVFRLFGCDWSDH